MPSERPYYRRARPAAQPESVAASDGTQVHFTNAWPLPPGDPVAAAQQLFDRRAAAVIRAAAGIDGSGDAGPPQIWPVIGWTVEPGSLPWHWVPATGAPWFKDRDLLELKWYDDKAPTIHIPRVKCLALLAYPDYFPDSLERGEGLRSMVSRAVLSASPGWCGTFGPGVDGLTSLKGEEGNYDMSEMHLVAMAYSYYDELSPLARDHLVTQLLANGRAHRPNADDTYTSKNNPNDWRRAGFVSPLGNPIDIGETENHILMIVTARYLTNQLLYQRWPVPEYDNLRNDGHDYPSCTGLLLSLLRNILRGDFSEYNAKSYQSETRWALLNLCSYAYDHAVRLGARMVLDYLSARVAVSSSDLRRLLPFRRRNNPINSAHSPSGFMTVGLLDTSLGADPMYGYFALQAGNLRACALPLLLSAEGVQHGLREPGADLAIELVSDYRLPPSIHDLFVNDHHRRFFQRLHRTPREDEVEGSRNCDNMEIYAGSPSYLITAGGAPARWALDPGPDAGIHGDAQAQQFGVAVPTSFIPILSGRGSATALGVEQARTAFQVIQFGEFSAETDFTSDYRAFGNSLFTLTTAWLKQVANYGVAPDFACGHQVYLPNWVNREVTQDIDGVPQIPQASRGFSFVNMGRTVGDDDPTHGGYYLAIYQETPGGLALLEAFDCLLDPKVSFDAFRAGVHARNGSLRLESNVNTRYTTSNGNVLEFVIWKDGDGERGSESGAEVLSIEYGDPTSIDALGNADQIPSQLLNGTIMNSPADAIVQIANPSRQATLTLDFSDSASPWRHDSETGEYEAAGPGSEVWLDFDYSGKAEGDVCRPFSTIADAVDGVADGGSIRIVPGATAQRGVIGGNKRFNLVAPAGGVTIGAANIRQTMGAGQEDEPVSSHDVWVQFDWDDSVFNHVPYLFNTIGQAVDAVSDGGVVHIQPGDGGLVNIRRDGTVANVPAGTTAEFGVIGNGKRFTLVAPIGGVTINRRKLVSP